jgi:ppGpp synthetase/RelA/SpoT-type nucleotidyltranferase
MFIPHPSDGSNCLAEIPKAYHAYGDDLSVYDGLKIDTKLKENGYRSVHYIVSFMGVYIEIQTRTIYDEAWNDCDHNYVYKKETHVSHSALSELSSALSMLTNASNDLGEKMQYIYEKEVIREKEGKYVSQDADLNFNDIFDKINNACHLLETFNSHFN